MHQSLTDFDCTGCQGSQMGGGGGRGLAARLIHSNPLQTDALNALSISLQTEGTSGLIYSLLLCKAIPMAGGWRVYCSFQTQ